MSFFSLLAHVCLSIRGSFGETQCRRLFRVTSLSPFMFFSRIQLLIQPVLVCKLVPVCQQPDRSLSVSSERHRRVVTQETLPVPLVWLWKAE